MYGYPQSYIQLRPKVKKGKRTHAKKEWKPKEIISCLIAHTSLRVSSMEDWYFDSGCSRHMTRERTCLEELKHNSNRYVIFSDKAKGRIMGIGKLVSLGLPNLKDVLLVEGLTAKLINISQLCDQGLNVKFNKFEYIVTNK